MGLIFEGTTSSHRFLVFALVVEMAVELVKTVDGLENLKMKFRVS